MRMNFGEQFEVEDLGNHPAVSVIGLGILLAGGASAEPDSKRKDFYEIEDGSTIYYIYVSPRSGKISLIASWRSLLGPVPLFEEPAGRSVSVR